MIYNYDDTYDMIQSVAFALVFIGALNWGLIGIGDFIGQNLNVVNLLLGTWPVVESVVYILVGLSGLILLARSPYRYYKTKSVIIRQ